VTWAAGKFSDLSALRALQPELERRFALLKESIVADGVSPPNAPFPK